MHFNTIIICPFNMFWKNSLILLFFKNESFDFHKLLWFSKHMILRGGGGGVERGSYYIEWYVLSFIFRLLIVTLVSFPSLFSSGYLVKLASLYVLHFYRISVFVFLFISMMMAMVMALGALTSPLCHSPHQNALFLRSKL